MFKRIILYGIVAFLGAVSSFGLSGVFTVVEVTGSSMEPAIEEGSKALVNKLIVVDDVQEFLQVGDVVAFKSDVHSEDGEGSILIRRVAGISGDEVEIKDNIFYLNGNPYQEYMAEAVHMEEMELVRLGENEIFVLSDDRKASMDSRNEAIGVLDTGDCIGKVCFE